MLPTPTARSVRPDTPFADAPATSSPRLASRLVGALSLAASLVLLSACADGTGGAAGDGDVDEDFLGTNPPAPNPVDAVVGVWDLTGNWDGREGDVASLVIREPDGDGEARVLLYDLDDLNGGANCYFRPPGGGVALPDVFGTRVFMDRVAPFDDAVLSVVDSTLVIDYVGANEVEQTYTAPRVAITETDLVPSCS